MDQRPYIVTLPDCGDSINLAHITRVNRAPTYTYLSFVGGEGNEYAIVGVRDHNTFETAWGMFRAGVADTEARRAEFTAIRERIVHAGMAIKARKTPELFAILEDLTGALVRLVDVVEGEAR